MKPATTPPLNRGEDTRTTPWQLIQRRRQPNEQQAGQSDQGNPSTRNHRSRRQKNGNQRDESQTTITRCWGIKDKDLASASSRTMKPNKRFGDCKSIKDESLIRCASHNIHNIPETRFCARSREIAMMAEGRDTADIRLWQEIGLFWPKVKEEDKWHKRTSSRALSTLANFGFNTREPHLSATKQPGGTAVITNARLSSRVREKGATDPAGGPLGAR